MLARKGKLKKVSYEIHVKSLHQDCIWFSKLRHAVIKGSGEVRLQCNIQSPSECITNASNKRALIMQHWKKPDMIREVWVIFDTIFECFSLLVSPKFLAETKLPAFGGKFWDFFANLPFFRDCRNLIVMRRETTYQLQPSLGSPNYSQTTWKR